MSADPARVEATASPWPARRLRAEELRARHAFAADVLTLYLALIDVQEDAWSEVRESDVAPAELARWAEERVLPAVVEATLSEGPEMLGRSVASRQAAGTAGDALAGWLADVELAPVDRYLARASLGPVLEAAGDQAGIATGWQKADDDDLFCPCCGGRPQLGYLESSGESLVTGKRGLLCARCGSSWAGSRTLCAACGESDESRLLVFSERWEGPMSGNGNGDDSGRSLLPHLRIAGCTTCSRYLIDVDLQRDARAVPEVDELAAIPLDLYAADQGLTKVTPNLMGF
jgi:formate dehydrogenase maturation protein FdhE